MKFKKLTAMFTALACAGVLASSFGMMTSATDSEPCDVNGDGYVNSSDILIIQKYLQGKTSSVGYNQLDANRDTLINSDDIRYISSKIQGGAYGNSIIKFVSRKNNTLYNRPSTSNPILDDYTNTYTTRAYRVYSYDTENFVAVYYQTPFTEPLNAQQSQNEPDSIVDGSDDRVYAGNLDEATGIVKIGSSATGFIVGDHVIATAGHCVYNTSTNNVCASDDIQVQLFDAEDSWHNRIPGTYLTPIEAHLPMDYVTPATRAVKYDYALIVVEEDLSDYYHFKLGSSYNVTQNKYTNVPIYVTGCPSQINVDPITQEGTDNSNNYLYTDEGRVTAINNKSVLHYNTDTTAGDSGAPVYTITRATGQTDDTLTVLGIHSGGSNQASLITKYQLQFYYSNNRVNNVLNAGTGTVTE